MTEKTFRNKIYWFTFLFSVLVIWVHSYNAVLFLGNTGAAASLVRLERDTQLLIPAYDYCLPEKECACQGAECGEDPCEIFRKVQFPVDEFFPPNSVAPKTAASYQEARSGCCGQ